MKEIIIEVPDRFGQKLKPEKVNSEIKGELVRCRDCKHFNDMKCSHPERGTCYLWHMLHWGDWFCADGERKDDDA